MSVRLSTSNGIFTYVIDGESTFTMPSAINGEPIMLRNSSNTICTVSPLSGQTINGGSSLTLNHEVCCYLEPIDGNWEYIHHNTPSLIGFPSGKGVGGSVTQITSVTTAVTLNKMTGKITMFAHDYSNNDIQTFTLNNSLIEEDDIIAVSMRSGSNKLNVQVDAVADGSCEISVGDIHNQSTGSISVVLNFAVIKGAVD
tara:strand:- start:51 stop:647 length:597 start_codon:yes stop_codon:yes gene_type:complete